MAPAPCASGGCISTASPNSPPPDSSSRSLKSPSLKSPSSKSPSSKTSLSNDACADHFVHRDGITFAGTHVLIDLWEARQLNDLAHMDAVLRSVVEQCGATLLHIHLHHFTPTGISGVAVLAESHISVHTWPERGFAAFDVFMCGAAHPEPAIPLLTSAFSAGRVEVREVRRGIVTGSEDETI